MLKNLNEMAKAEVITVDNGRVQAVNGPLAYIGFLQNFVGHQFSVDAKILASALKTLEDDFMCHSSKEKVVVFDSEREITFTLKIPEQLLPIPQKDWTMRDIAYPWNVTDKFVQAQYPGIKMTEGYFETLSDSSILRVNHHLQIEELEKEFVFAKCKLAAKSIGYCISQEKLWIQYPDSNFIAISALDIEFPSTDEFFKGELRYKPIPNLKTKLVPADTVSFRDGNLYLYKEGSAEAIIENVEGTGEYDFKLFSKVVTTAEAWQHTDTALFFSGMNFRGVIENVRH